MAKIASLEIILSAQIAEFRSAMNEAADKVKSVENQLKSAGEAVRGFLGGIAIEETLRRSAEATLEWARSIEELSARTGLSAQAASDLTVSAREQGVAVDTLQTFMQRLTQEIARKPGEFEKMGIAIRDSSGNLLSMTQIAENTVKGLEQFKAGTDRAAAGTALLGRGAGQVVGELGRLGDTFEGVAHAAKLAQDLGLELDEKQIAQAREWERSLADLQLAFLGVENQLGKALLPEVEKFTDEIIRLSADGSLQRWGKEAGSAFHILGEAIEGDLMILDGLTTAINKIAPPPGSASAGLFGWLPGAAGPSRETLLAPSTAADEARWKRERAERDAAAAGGTKSFTADLGSAGRTRITDAQKATEEYAKLSAQIQEQTSYENALALAYGRGDAAVLQVTEAQKAYEAAVRLGKGASQEQIAAIEQASLKLQETEARVKAAEKAHQDLNKQIDEANRLYEQSIDDTQKYEKEIDQLNQLLEHGKITMEVYQGAIKIVNQQMADATKAEQGTFGADISKDLTSSAEKLVNIFEGGRKSARQWHDELLKWILDLDKTFTDTLLKDFVLKPLETSLTNWLNGAAGSGLFGLFGGTTAAASVGTFAAGGIVGEGGVMKSVSPFAFAGAPRFASGGIVGLGADEVPIIAHRGEQVVPVNQVGKDSGGGQARPNVVNIYVTTPDATSFGASQGQILADAHRSLTVLGRRNI